MLLMPFKDGQTGLFWKRAFKRSGFKFSAVDSREDITKIYPKIEAFKPDVIITGKEGSLQFVVPFVKRKHPYIQWWCVNPDVRNSVSEFTQSVREIFKYIDVFMIKTLGMIPEYQETYPQAKVFWLPQSVDIETYHNNYKRFDPKKLACSVSFIGNTGYGYVTPAGGRRRLLPFIQKHVAEFMHYGDNNQKYDDDHNHIVMSSKINIGHCGYAHMDGANSVRDMKIMAAGGFLLTERVKNSKPIFRDGFHWVEYVGIQDCVDKINYYLYHPEERNKIAKRGQDAVMNHHTYDIRLQEMLNLHP